MICYQMVVAQLSCLLSSVCAEAGGKKLRSTVQRSTETGLAVEMRNWMTRQASRESTDGSMNSYSSEGKWVRPAWRASLPCLCLRPSSVSLSALSQKLTHTLHSTTFTFPGWFAVRRTSFLLTCHWEMWPMWLFISKEIGLGTKCLALTARR